MADPAEPPWEAADIRRVRGVLAMGGVPWDDLDDGVQQVGLKLLEERARPRPQRIRNRAGWLAVVASRVAADWHRNRTRDNGLRERLAARWAQRPPVHPQEDRALALTLADALDEMDTALRQVLTLRYFADLPVRDIALLLDVPEGTVKSRLHRAVAALRIRLGEMEVI